MDKLKKRRVTVGSIIKCGRSYHLVQSRKKSGIFSVTNLSNGNQSGGIDDVLYPVMVDPEPYDLTIRIVLPPYSLSFFHDIRLCLKRYGKQIQWVK